MRRIIIAWTASLLLGMYATAGAEESMEYVPETDPLVLEKLEQWQDLKFGLLMHWAASSQWGIVESWSLSPEDYGWCERRAGDNPGDYFAYKHEYEGLKNTFNPVEFDPSLWAEAAAHAGMRYVVFTTKHHDGFCMFDTRETDYKVTDEGCPFHSHPQADITRAIFDAFREKGMWTGAYFSKPDWHNENYWHPYFPPRDRNVNYDPEEYPERWDKFVRFTHNQIMELASDYGRLDILWLDGGWVEKADPERIRKWYEKKIKKTPLGFLKHHFINQDIRMDELVAKVRVKQPGLIVVDRAVHGKNQNYLTPENRVPEKALSYPWESCIVAGGGWSWVPDARYRSVRETVHMLVDIVAKGGNLLLNIGPAPDGTWDEGAYELLQGVGDWMAINNEAIYDTRAMAPYKTGRNCFTRKTDDGAVFAIHLAGEGETGPPASIEIDGIVVADNARVTMLGVEGPLEWKFGERGLTVTIPSHIRTAPPCAHAWVLRISPSK
ncbi:MAG: alpha-L-fucosidase [Candidatus Krumholzibacteriota bacterium]